jgi:hypothetical protein
MACDHIYDARTGGMSGGAAADYDPTTPEEKLCISGLTLVRDWICTADATLDQWTLGTQNEFNASFERFMQVFEESPIPTTRDEEQTWRDTIRQIKKTFLEKFALETFKMNVAQTLLGAIQDENKRLEQETREIQRRKKNMEEIVENFMLLVNASFLYAHEAKNLSQKFEFMQGVQFPGLWSRVLYDDPTPNQKYRNMLVGNRPGFLRIFDGKQTLLECPKDQADGWSLMLHCARMHINAMLEEFPDTILSEYDTNVNYALNYWKNYDVQFCDPPRDFDSKPVFSVDHMTKAVEGGKIYDMAAQQQLLPRHLGKPCGVTTTNGFIFILTTDGEIFKVQTMSLALTPGRRCDYLISDPTKCIVEAPNRCVITRLNFTKNTAEFPALKCHMPDNAALLAPPPGSNNWFEELSPTCLLADPRGKTSLYVLSHAQGKIYEITFVGFWSKIQVHAGGNPKTRDTPRKLQDADENQDNVVFDGLMCGVFDSNFDLYVCDGLWIRKIKYESRENRAKFTVSNILKLQAPASSIVCSRMSLVIAEIPWGPGYRHKQVIREVLKYADESAPGRYRYEARDIYDNERILLGSLLVDGAEHIVYCGRNLLVNLVRGRLRGSSERFEKFLMHEYALTGSGLRYLTWFGGNILMCTMCRDGPVLLAFQKKGEKKREREAASVDTGAGAEARAGKRPQTAPAPVAPASMDALLEQLAELCVRLV